MLKIVKYPDTILEEVMPAFDFANPIMDPKELETEMLAVMFAHDGIGLAAPQVGIRTRVFTMGHILMKEQSSAYFNPEVVDASTDLLDVEEGCLSFPTVFVKIKRPSWIVGKYFDSEGNEHQNKFEGYDCKCFLHELDHLNGINFKDRLSTLKWAMAVKKSKKVKVRNYA
jgi:peptide deformylase